MAGCHELVADLRSARTVESSSDFDSSGRTGARETNSSANVPTGVLERTSPTMWEEDSTTKWNKYARTIFPNCVVVHWKRGESEAKECVIMK